MGPGQHATPLSHRLRLFRAFDIAQHCPDLISEAHRYDGLHAAKSGAWSSIAILKCVITGRLLTERTEAISRTRTRSRFVHRTESTESVIFIRHRHSEEAPEWAILPSFADT